MITLSMITLMVKLVVFSIWRSSNANHNRECSVTHEMSTSDIYFTLHLLYRAHNSLLRCAVCALFICSQGVHSIRTCPQLRVIELSRIMLGKGAEKIKGKKN